MTPLEKAGDSKHTLGFELGALLPTDASARLGNWYCNDVEKILHDVTHLNAAAELLPCETWHEGGQNPAAASSIGATQHIQLGRGSTADFPLLLLKNHPVWLGELQAHLDLCQVGDDVDAFYVQLLTRRPMEVALVQTLQELRIGLLREFGARNMDFDVHALPVYEPKGGPGLFCVTFAPIAAMVRQADKSFVNKVSKRSSIEFNVPVNTVDSSNGKGNCMGMSANGIACGVDEGRDMIARLYDLNALPGSRRFVRSFLLKRFAYLDIAKVPGEIWLTCL